ncbi:mPR-like GPCR protein [Amylocarpus encephaloides]|uniref:MPR-like GPCR protein n=1 Tax=Amylocarpus encephaloides TaxID=45428 RepID=A0A9P7YMP4_9HELO|nr:mPR-like GPCR protein [Amylocarpus encephaloides]
MLLLLWHELHNEFILPSYRPASGSFARSLRSLGHIHNETVNVFSHLFGGVLFGILPFYVYRIVYPRYASAQLGDIVVFSTFFFGVAVCFLLSAFFHNFANHSERVAASGNQLDYMGVVVLMWGSTIPSKLYWSVVSVLATACIATTLNPRFRHPQLRPYRAAMYSGLGLSAIVFILHGLVLHGWELQNRRMSLGWMGLMGALNLIGAAAYAARVPERWYPLRHDIYGSSHQILHSWLSSLD